MPSRDSFNVRDDINVPSIKTAIVYFWPGTGDIHMFLLLYPLGNIQFCLFR